MSACGSDSGQDGPEGAACHLGDYIQVRSLATGGLLRIHKEITQICGCNLKLVGPNKVNISKNPQLHSEKWPTKTATKSWRSWLYFRFLLSQFLCLFPLVSRYFLLFHAILEPQNSPPNEVTYVCLYMCIRSKNHKKCERDACYCQGPFYCPQGMFKGEGWGVYILRPPRQDFNCLTPPALTLSQPLESDPLYHHVHICYKQARYK